jgi:hypothetical protein
MTLTHQPGSDGSYRTILAAAGPGTGGEHQS